MSDKTVCPRCGGTLTAAFEEHTDYPVLGIDDDMVDIESECGESYDVELIHISCDECGTYWYSTAEFNKERGK